jgi:hypothetical protein
MAARVKHRTKLTGAEDRFVPINGEMLAVVMQELGVSPARLAAQAGTSAQNIEHMVKTGSKRRCRAGLRARIATHLGTSEALLAGDQIAYPGGLLTPSGFEYRYSIRTEHMASRLLTKVAEACFRDLQQERSVDHLHASDPSVQEIIEPVVRAVADLIRVKEWRQRLIVWRPGVELERGHTEPASSSEVQVHGLASPPRQKGVRWPKGAKIVQWEGKLLPTKDVDHEEGVLALIRGMEHVLKPWFENEARLNYDALYRLTQFAPWREESYGTDPLAPPAINPEPPSTPRPPTRGKAKQRPASSPSSVKKSTVKRRAP